MQVDRYLRKGRVSVNGTVVRGGAHKFYDTVELRVDGDVLEALPLLIAFHKPKGIVSTLSDDWDRTHLKDVLPATYLQRMHPVGRLDADSSGLLLLSSDGTLTHKLLQPKFKVEREYECLVEPAEGMPPPGDELVEKLREGVATTDGVFPGEVTNINGLKVSLIVKEGKYRMVRRMLANAGYPVVELHRTRYGDIVMDENLQPGQCAPVVGSALTWAQWLRRTCEKKLLVQGPHPRIRRRMARKAEGGAQGGAEEEGETAIETVIAQQL
ncbi:pseudouridine synthase [Tribonema minus]|uniref:Pseudouridine synthase n=1 Tax=Tribonema minus TaxID=303371 RepID=A0A835YWQ3_9STRA|nr:pseudouridine synthase [Tribonema minus]